MERECERCKTVTMIDSFHRLCFDCFCDLDMKAVEEEEFLLFLEEDEAVPSAAVLANKAEGGGEEE